MERVLWQVKMKVLQTQQEQQIGLSAHGFTARSKDEQGQNQMKSEQNGDSWARGFFGEMEMNLVNGDSLI